MAMFDWRGEFSVGIEAIDTDHKFLVSLINQLDKAVAEGQGKEAIGNVLNALYDFTEYHFAREEHMMAACGYPDMDRHAMQHKAMTAQVMEVRDDYLAGQTNGIDHAVLEFLEDWLGNHIICHDLLYQSCMQTSRDAVDEAARKFQENMDRMQMESDIRR